MTIFDWNCFKGKQLGRTIGFPTAHKIKEDYKLIPLMASMVKVSSIKKLFWNDEHWIQPYRIWRKLSIEIHFLDFDADLYDQKLTISVLKHLRPEQNLIPLIY
jgi:riboflavin kinase/FMN adenylyltransferase